MFRSKICVHAYDSLMDHLVLMFNSKKGKSFLFFNFFYFFGIYTALYSIGVITSVFPNYLKFGEKICKGNKIRLAQTSDRLAHTGMEPIRTESHSSSTKKMIQIPFL
eukprot:TRINITY_DN28596_c0_g1_i1.p1 TRINITY_DN28596_c0_g1~~TRINITY_DN28596_c0_g1_i1.p1  ORF type:complete len:107 (+),score=0.37 TRINITY_DN28596_c0_g1_i1:216-536(+)